MHRTISLLTQTRVVRFFGVLIAVALVATFLIAFKAGASNRQPANAIKKNLAGGFLAPSPTLNSCDTGQNVEVEATAGTLGPTGYGSLSIAMIAINNGTHQGAINIEICGNTVRMSSTPAIARSSSTEPSRVADRSRSTAARRAASARR